MTMSVPKVVAFVAVIVVALGSESEDVGPSENGITSASACASEFLEWCRNRSDSNSGQNYGFSVLHHNYFDGDESVVILCVSDSICTNCTKNKLPWFLCFRNGTLEYKGKELGSVSGDDDICSTKDHAKGMFPQRPPFNQTAFEIGMKLFREKMRQFELQMKELGERLQGSKSNFMSGNREP